jgi:glycosidase
MTLPRYPALFQVNTRVLLSERAAALGRAATLDDVPETEIAAWASDGFDLVWFLGVWQTGEVARGISRRNPQWLAEYHRVLPDFREEDVCGSCFAIRAYRVHGDFGADEALARLRERLKRRGLGLILDFVPNHMASDHPWVSENPDYFVSGTEEQLAAQPQNFCRVTTGKGSRILAYGRDPSFDGWPDTLQLDYGNPALQEAMLEELARIARQCDGVRCDMAMLVLPEVFENTWTTAAAPFWPAATSAVRAELPGFLFLAEAYWDLEWTLQQQGFDYTYDKRLYDRLEQGHARAVREHLHAGLDFQDHLARFLENHDEPRAAAAFAPDVHKAAALITFLTPGLRVIHQGQREGRRVRIPVHLSRGPSQAVDQGLRAFYDTLMRVLGDPAFRDGAWQLLNCRPAWDGNRTWDGFLSFSWSGPGDSRRLVTVNYASHQAQCYVDLPWCDLDGSRWRLVDLMGDAAYDREGGDLVRRGLYLDMPPWGAHVFAVSVFGVS